MHEPTIQDVLDAISSFSSSVDERFGFFDQKFITIDQRFTKIDQRFEQIDHRFEQIDKRFEQIDERFERSEQDILGAIAAFSTSVDQRFEKVECEVSEIQRTMVTKAYLDQKLTELRNDLMLLARKANRKLEVVIDELVGQGSLNRDVADRILMLEPFAHA